VKQSRNAALHFGLNLLYKGSKLFRVVRFDGRWKCFAGSIFQRFFPV